MNGAHRSRFVSPRRRNLQVVACTPSSSPPSAESVKDQLERLLHAIPTLAGRATEGLEHLIVSLPSQMRAAFREGGPLAVLNVWESNRGAIQKASSALVQRGGDVIGNGTGRASLHPGGIELPWTAAWRQPKRTSSTGEDDGDGHSGGETLLRNVALFALESLSPWDFDNHDFGLTFVNVWNDEHSMAATNSGPQAQGTLPQRPIKVTSTLKPLASEWKVTARTMLYATEKEDGVIFGKAGMYLVGNGEPFIGLEADRVWGMNMERTKLFANVNYRNSRTPLLDVVRLSCGIQHEFTITKGLDVTLRLGLYPLERRKWFATPVPNGGYF